MRGVAIVGTGGIAAVHADNMARLADRLRLVAAVDTEPGPLAAFAERWGVPRTYRSLDDLLDHEQPDLVVLATPPGVHHQQAVACLDRGLTVVCEKPPALSLAEMDAIALAAEAGGGQFATVSQHRFGGGAIRLRELAGGPVLGRPLAAVCDTLWYRPDGYFDNPWRGRWDTEGGGPTMGHGIHQMDLMLSILGPWREVVAVAGRLARPTNTEDISAALVTFESGVVATVINSLLSPRETSFLRFDFEYATVELEHLYGYGDDSWRVTGAPDRTEEAGTLAQAWAAGAVGLRSGHASQMAAVLDALDAKQPPPVALPDARATLELIAGIYASAFGGGRVRRGEIGPGHPFYGRMDGTGAPWAPVTTTASARG